MSESTLSVEVGQRLRAVRRQRRWSLDDVEHRSEGRWSASAVGAYERGYRNLTLPRLQELAEFYGVTMSLLLGEDEGATPESGRLSLDLHALEQVPAALPVLRFANRIRAQRGDHASALVTLRADDLRSLATVLDLDDAELYERLHGWGVLAATAGADPVRRIGPDDRAMPNVQAIAGA